MSRRHRSHCPEPLPPLAPRDYKRRRRDRRMARNLAHEQQAREQAAAHGFQLTVHNGGHHWLLRRDGFVAEWWPSSAKLVLDRDYSRNIHAHDWPQVLAALCEYRSGTAQGCLF